MFSKSIKAHKNFQSQDYFKMVDLMTDSSVINFIKENAILKILISTGVQEKEFIVSKEYISYLEKELSCLIKYSKNFDYSFFLAFEIIEEYRNKKHFVNIGRGSLAGSLLAFISGITKIDPVVNKFHYQRFAPNKNTEQISIDLDLSDREIALDFVKAKYGKYFTFIGTENKWKLKGTLGEVLSREEYLGKFAHGYIDFLRKQADDEIDKPGYLSVKNTLDLLNGIDIPVNRPLVTMMLSVKIKKEFNSVNEESELFDLLEKYNPHFNSLFLRFPKLKSDLKKLIGTHNKFGINAAALALVPDSSKVKFLDQKRDDVNRIIHPDYADSEDIIKINVMQLKVLQDLNQLSEKKIKEIVHKPIDDKSEWIDLMNSPISWDVFQQANEIMALFKEKEKITSLDAFAQLTSTMRPGALNAGVNITEQNKNTPERFKEILLRTNGWLVWQDDVLAIADLVGVKDSRQMLSDFAKKNEVNNYLEFFSEEEFKFLYDNVILAFNKAHAYAYGINSLLDYRLKKINKRKVIK